jgi:hypothetical protein
VNQRRTRFSSKLAAAASEGSGWSYQSKTSPATKISPVGPSIAMPEKRVVGLFPSPFQASG